MSAYKTPFEAGALTGADAGYTDAVAITPSNTVDLTRPCNAIYVGGGGATKTITVITVAGTLTPMVGVLTGEIYKVHAKRVKVAGTDATNLIALY